VTGRSPAISALLLVPAAAYGAIMRLRNAWYDRKGSTRAATVPVISVGNLAAGGTGKTPLVAWIARRLKAHGLVAAVVSRGYGGTAGPGPLVVSTGSGPRVDARTCGDEPHLLARSLPGAIVVVGSDRIEGARCAAAAGAGAVVLDDGFQHRRLARDLDVVVLDGRAPFRDGHLLPRGLLRERPSALSRADVVVLTRLHEGDAAETAIRDVRKAGYSGLIVRAGHKAVGFRDVAGAACPAPPRAIAFCGIGDPELFRADLQSAHVTPLAFHAFRDHNPYTIAGWNALTEEAKSKGAPLVTTEKDLSRLEAAVGASLSGAPLVVLAIETVVWDAVPFWEAIKRAVTHHAEESAR
jgi:tetraacyldisaccharide 4'-kinase